MSQIDKHELIRMTSNVVSVYLSNNTVDPGNIPDLINSVYVALSGVGNEKQELEPAVPIRKSITPSYIVCLEDGKQLKMLKRHLKTRYNMTPEEYRERWGLPRDYPMVAPNYSKERAKMAKKIGLGRNRSKR